jgi:hypothetical protein
MFSGFTSGTRTVKTFFSDGTGPPKVETHTYNIGGPAGSKIGFTPGGGGGGAGNFFSGGDVNIGFGDSFGGRGLNFGVGGGDGGQRGGGGGGGMPIRFKGFSGPSEPRPKIEGRPQQREKKNPFIGIKGQKYADVKSQCRGGGALFEDPEFPAEDNSIFFSQRPPRRFEWKRPHVSSSYL